MSFPQILEAGIDPQQVVLFNIIGDHLRPEPNLVLMCVPNLLSNESKFIIIMLFDTKLVSEWIP